MHEHQRVAPVVGQGRRAVRQAARSRQLTDCGRSASSGTDDACPRKLPLAMLLFGGVPVRVPSRLDLQVLHTSTDHSPEPESYSDAGHNSLKHNRRHDKANVSAGRGARLGAFRRADAAVQSTTRLPCMSVQSGCTSAASSPMVHWARSSACRAIAGVALSLACHAVGGSSVTTTGTVLASCTVQQHTAHTVLAVIPIIASWAASATCASRSADGARPVAPSSVGALSAAEAAVHDVRSRSFRAASTAAANTAGSASDLLDRRVLGTPEHA